MNYYFINKIAENNGDYEVHKVDCNFLPDDSDRLYLGVFSNCKEAMIKAKEIYDQSNGCYNCCSECYTVNENKVIWST